MLDEIPQAQQPSLSSLLHGNSPKRERENLLALLVVCVSPVLHSARYSFSSSTELIDVESQSVAEDYDSVIAQRARSRHHRHGPG